jgi:hypothetical protein
MIWQLYASSIFGSDNQQGEDKMYDLQIGQCFYTAGETNLFREPKSMLEIQEWATILSMPKNSRVVLESAEVRTLSGLSWYNVKYIQDEVENIGWIVVGSGTLADSPTPLLTKDQRFTTKNDLDVRREPNLNSKTEDGKDNVFLSIDSNTLVLIESVDVHTGDGHTWYYIRHFQDPVENTGWVDSDPLREGLPSTGGGGSTYYSFKFGTGTYSISDENLGNALRQYKYIADKPTSGMQQFFFEGSATPFFTSQDNVNSMKKAGLID